MMNDALECCLVLKECTLAGEYIPGGCGEIKGELVREDSTWGLIVRQGKENTFALWFKEMEQILKCFQYHRIGHFWVEGQEQWRQLVYLAGTIYDKFEYMGETVCNEMEKELLKLMKFGPFTSWSPIKESLEEKYPPTCEGLEYMRSLAVEAGDPGYVRLIGLYQRFPSRCLQSLLARALLAAAREPLYQLIWKKVTAASESYPEREYSKEMNRKIRERREQTARILEREGFTGVYPEFRRGTIGIVAAEEHPFTMLEEDGYSFRIQFMVSECRKGDFGTNSGFFNGWGRRGWIEKDLSFLEACSKPL